MISNRIWVGLGALLLMSSPALADGMRSVKDAPVCCEANWNGLSIGAGVGVSVFLNRQTDIVTGPPPPGLPPPPPVTDPFDAVGGSSILGTVSIGYDRQVAPGVVIGVFTDYDFSDTEFEHTNGVVETIRLRDTWSVGARIGLVRSCCTLWYVNAGYANADFRYRFTDASLATFAHDDRVGGWFAGVGVEQQIGRGLSLKLEYRFNRFEDAAFSFVDTGGTTHDMKFEPELHTVRLALTYRFDVHRDRYVAPLK
jgi:outer membrane immunogenic protein